MPTKPFSRFRVLNESEIHACTAIIAVVLVRRHDISLADLSRDQFFAQHYHILHNLEPQRVIVDRPARKVILLVLLVAAVFLNGMPTEPRIIAQRLRTRQEALKVSPFSGTSSCRPAQAIPRMPQPVPELLKKPWRQFRLSATNAETKMAPTQRCL